PGDPGCFQRCTPRRAAGALVPMLVVSGPAAAQGRPGGGLRATRDMCSAGAGAPGDHGTCRPTANRSAPGAVAALSRGPAEGLLLAGELPAKSGPWLARRV